MIKVIFRCNFLFLSRFYWNGLYFTRDWTEIHIQSYNKQNLQKIIAIRADRSGQKRWDMSGEITSPNRIVFSCLIWTPLTEVMQYILSLLIASYRIASRRFFAFNLNTSNWSNAIYRIYSNRTPRVLFHFDIQTRVVLEARVVLNEKGKF